MGKNLFTSIFRSPLTYLVMFVGLLELGVRFFWTPDIVGESLYYSTAPNFDYGFDMNNLFVRRGDKIIFMRERFRRIYPQEINVQKPNGAIRVIVHGTSPAHKPYGSPYSKFLQEDIQKLCPHSPVEVLNLTVDGYGTTRLLKMMGATLFLKPDIVVFDPHGSNEYEDERDTDYSRHLHQGWRGLLLHSKAIIVSKKWFSSLRLKDADDQPESIAGYPDEDAAGLELQNRARWWNTLVSNIDRFIQLSRNHKFGLVLVTRAERDTPDPDSVNVKLRKLLQERAQKDGIKFFDKQRSLAKTDYTDNSHFDTKGAAKIGSDLALYLQKEKILNCGQN